MSHLTASTPYVFQRRNTFYFRFTFSRIISKLVGKRELRYCFQKKSPSGIRTAKNDVDLIHERLKTAQADYEAHYGKDN